MCALPAVEARITLPHLANLDVGYGICFPLQFPATPKEKERSTAAALEYIEILNEI